MAQVTTYVKSLYFWNNSGIADPPVIEDVYVPVKVDKATLKVDIEWLAPWNLLSRLDAVTFNGFKVDAKLEKDRLRETEVTDKTAVGINSLILDYSIISPVGVYWIKGTVVARCTAVLTITYTVTAEQEEAAKGEIEAWAQAKAERRIEEKTKGEDWWTEITKPVVTILPLILVFAMLSLVLGIIPKRKE